MLLYFVLGDANFLRRPFTFLFFCVDFFALGSKRKPHFQWNIGCVGSLALGLCVGHVHFMLFVHFFLAFGSQPKAVSGGIWAFIKKNKKTAISHIIVPMSIAICGRQSRMSNLRVVQIGCHYIFFRSCRCH